MPIPVTVETPLGPDALVFASMRGTESLSAPFAYVVHCVSDDATVNLDALLGQPINVQLTIGPDTYRYWNGIVTAVDFDETTRPKAAYRLALRPWLWLLTNTTNCRIFQNKSIPDIIKAVFRDGGFSDFDDALTETYPVNDYVVQYRESDFNFVSRLMQHVGIYYFFRHAKDTHTLVLADSASAHQVAAGCRTLPYRAPDGHRDFHLDYVDRWHLSHELTSGVVSLRDFDFERPRADLSSKLSSPMSHARANLEVYDYPGRYIERGDGETLARVRLEERQLRYETLRGHTNARNFTNGALFTLEDHPRSDQNREYLVTSCEVTVSGSAVQSGPGNADFPFSAAFHAVSSARPYRPAMTAIKPRVEGPQTAIVVGKSGEEIWSDKYGRVKVQFHWDREGGSDESSSCWVRVAQVWAGANWGAIHVPRMGQEVIVDFLEGDPDRPIITGRVYNGANMPPYALPANQTQSGIKSRSSKKGGQPNFNELRFEDLKGSEEVSFQAEKDLNSLVKNHETRKVGVNRTTSIGSNETLTVGANRKKHVKANEDVNVDVNETIAIGGNQSVTVGGDQTWAVGGNDATTIGGNQSLAVGGDRDHLVGGAETILIVGPQTIATPAQTLIAGTRTKVVATTESVTIGSSKSESIGSSLTLSVGGARTESVGGDDELTIEGALTINVGKGGALAVVNSFVIDAGDELVLRSGDASITLKKNGDIVLKGKDITSEASGKVTLKASSDLTLKGSKISQN